MSRALNLARLAFAATPLLLLAGCATLGGHVSGRFSCRAPQGDCAPSRVIDAKAIAGLSNEQPDSGAAISRPASAPARAASGDIARTREHMLRIVFPAHIDSAGILHDEATAWVVAEPSDWAARLRAGPVDASPRALARAIGGRLKSPRADDRGAAPMSSDEAPPLPEDPLLSLTSPGGLPPTPREVDAGAHAPGIEGFDTPAPSVRTPRSSLVPGALMYPTIEAIEAAHARFRLKPSSKPLLVAPPTKAPQ